MLTHEQISGNASVYDHVLDLNWKLPLVRAGVLMR